MWLRQTVAERKYRISSWDRIWTQLCCRTGICGLILFSVCCRNLKAMMSMITNTPRRAGCRDFSVNHVERRWVSSKNALKINCKELRKQFFYKHFFFWQIKITWRSNWRSFSVFTIYIPHWLGHWVFICMMIILIPNTFCNSSQSSNGKENLINFYPNWANIIFCVSFLFKFLSI